MSHYCGKPDPSGLRRSCIERIWQCDECKALDYIPEIPEYEKRLDLLFDTAFGSPLDHILHPESKKVMEDWVAVKFELRELREKATKQI
jgi:hypothetical protein